jgi:putative flippase GtrA
MRFVRMVGCGGAATAVDTALLLALYRSGATSAGIAAVIGCMIGGLVNYLLNRTYVFGDGRSDRAWPGEALRYGSIVVGGGAVVSGIVVAAATGAGVPVLVAKLVAIAVTMVAWTYPMSSRVVFAARPSPIHMPSCSGIPHAAGSSSNPPTRRPPETSAAPAFTQMAM